MLLVAIHCQKNRNDTHSTYDREHAAIYIICTTLMVQYMYIFHMAMSSNGGQHQRNEYNNDYTLECGCDIHCMGYHVVLTAIVLNP